MHVSQIDWNATAGGRRGAVQTCAGSGKEGRRDSSKAQLSKHKDMRVGETKRKEKKRKAIMQKGPAGVLTVLVYSVKWRDRDKGVNCRGLLSEEQWRAALEGRQDRGLHNDKRTGSNNGRPSHGYGGTAWEMDGKIKSRQGQAMDEEVAQAATARSEIVTSLLVVVVVVVSQAGG